MDLDAQKLKEAYQKAPEAVQEFIISDELSNTFEKIRKTHQLHLDEASNMSDALNAVFLEVKPFDAFPNLLKQALEQNRAKYDAVLKDINELIFVPFRKSLQQKEEKVEEPVPEPEAAPTPAPQAAEPAINKLEKSTFQKPETVELGTPPEGEIKKEESKNTPPVDPYREPID